MIFFYFAIFLSLPVRVTFLQKTNCILCFSYDFCKSVISFFHIHTCVCLQHHYRHGLSVKRVFSFRTIQIIRLMPFQAFSFATEYHSNVYRNVWEIQCNQTISVLPMPFNLKPTWWLGSMVTRSLIIREGVEDCFRTLGTQLLHVVLRIMNKISCRCTSAVLWECQRVRRFSWNGKHSLSCPMSQNLRLVWE